MAGRVGPALAGLLTLGALAGAAVAEHTAVFPRAAAVVAPAGLDGNGCALTFADVVLGSGADLAEALVPLAAVSASVCRYDSASTLGPSIRLDGLATAKLAADLGALPQAKETVSATPIPSRVWLVAFHYGTRPDVVVRVGGGFASNGARAASTDATIVNALERLTAP